MTLVKSSSTSQQLYQVRVSARFLLLSVLSSALLAWSLGRFAWRVLLHNSNYSNNLQTLGVPESDATLPTPTIKVGKTVPSTKYTSKIFDTDRPVLSRSLFLEADNNDDANKKDGGLPKPILKKGKLMPENKYTERIFEIGQPVTANSLFLEQEELTETAIPTSERVKDQQNQSTTMWDDQDDEEHLPAGQHLLVDINGIDGSFLDSEKRLASAMVDLVYECGLTMLSYHCFHLKPSGVSCAGVLLESHVSFHTWPEAGVITLDLFTCGANSLLPHVDLIEQLFAIPRSDSAEAPKMLWAYKRRGFSEGFGSGMVKSTDIFAHPLGMRGLEMKQEIMSIESHHEQIIRVYDVIQHPYNSLASYEKSLSKEKSYESEHPDLFQPDRLVFLDGVLKTRRRGESASHESLVHPAMITHSEPKNVAMVGAGEGATLREVLKHKSVERVVVLEADETIVQVAKEHLKDWNDCSNLVGGSPSCFDDPRVEIYYEDGPTWFSRRRQDNDKFDVVIVDTLDGDEYEEDESEYNDKSFFASIHNALSEEGIVVVHVGGEVETGDAPKLRKRAMRTIEPEYPNHMSWMQSLSSSGFAETRFYEENHGGFVDLRSYLVGFKSLKTIENWNRNEASVSLEITKRSVPTVDGSLPFHYFDGPAMVSYTGSRGREWDPRQCQFSQDSKYCETLLKWNRNNLLTGKSSTDIKECGVRDETMAPANTSISNSDKSNPGYEESRSQYFVSDVLQS